MTLAEIDEKQASPTTCAEFDAEARAAGRAPRRPLRLAVAGILAAGVLLTLILGVQSWSAAADEARERAVLVAARQTVTDLITVDATSAPEVYERLRTGATGEWGDQLAGEADRFVGAIQGAQVTSQGRITEAAAERVDDESATVLVAALASVTNRETATPEARQYRVSLDLVRVDDRWLVAKLDFVP